MVLRSGKALFRSCSGANSRQLDHYIIPTLVNEKPDIVLQHHVTIAILGNANDTELANNLINIGLNCKNYIYIIKEKSRIKSCYSKESAK